MFSRYKEIPVTKLESILEALSAPGTLNLHDYDLLVYGGGGQSRSYFNNLSNDTEVEILWTGWCGPKWTSFLSFIPGQAGLVKLLKPTRLKPLFEDLASHSVSDLYYVPKALTERIKQAVISGPSSHDFKKILESEMSFLYLQCEMDETVMRNDEECYLFDIAIGQKLPDNVKALFSID
ncbi:MAG TPA: hypothetical protein VD884_11600 [Ohtaekwangia sp.]|nr:hypothetical protein [Ohtaekwangia sp.]